MAEHTVTVPPFAQLVGGDNRPVGLPVWYAEKVLDMLDRYLRRVPSSRTPCYAAEEHDAWDDLRRLVALAKGLPDPADVPEAPHG